MLTLKKAVNLALVGTASIGILPEAHSGTKEIYFEREDGRKVLVCSFGFYENPKERPFNITVNNDPEAVVGKKQAFIINENIIEFAEADENCDNAKGFMVSFYEKDKYRKSSGSDNAFAWLDCYVKDGTTKITLKNDQEINAHFGKDFLRLYYDGKSKIPAFDSRTKNVALSNKYQDAFSDWTKNYYAAITNIKSKVPGVQFNPHFLSEFGDRDFWAENGENSIVYRNRNKESQRTGNAQTTTPAYSANAAMSAAPAGQPVKVMSAADKKAKEEAAHDEKMRALRKQMEKEGVQFGKIQKVGEQTIVAAAPNSRELKTK
jgi:hypothetical protein